MKFERDIEKLLGVGGLGWSDTRDGKSAKERGKHQTLREYISSISYIYKSLNRAKIVARTKSDRRGRLDKRIIRLLVCTEI